MILEVTFAVFVVIVAKACCAVDWTSRKNSSYSKTGCLFGVKKWIFLLACKVFRLYQNVAKLCASTRYRHQHRDFLQSRSSNRKNVTEILHFHGFAESGDEVTDDTAVSLQLTVGTDSHAELCLYLQVPGHGFLQHPAHPDAIVCRPSGGTATLDGRTYTADGLVIELKEPDRRWRISYRGMMRMVDTLKEPARWSDGKNLVYVKFGFTWTAYSSPYNFAQQIDDNILSEATAREFWSFNFFRKLKTFKGNHRYREQWGQLRGALYVDGMEEGQVGRELTLRGPRGHFSGQHNWSAYHRYVRVTAHLKSGFTLSLTAACVSDVLTHVVCGYVVQPNRRLRPVTWCDLSLPRHGEDGRIPNLIQFNVAAGSAKCNVVCLIKLAPQVNNGLEWKGKTHHCLADIFINSLPGRGVVEFYYRTPNAVCPINRVKPSSPFAARFPPSDSDKLFLSLAEPGCQNKKLVGEIGSQLACLKALTTSKRMSEFYVTNGFCLTSLAFEQHVKANTDLQETLEAMAEVLRNGGNEELRDICNRFYAQTVNSTLAGPVASGVAERFRKLANASRRSGLRVHVRSSLVGEIPQVDETQRTEFENLTGVNQILKAVLKCWANQRAYEAVLYRRQNGFEALPPMAVVVQAMVEDARAHGVITTCEESSGDPTVLFLHANYVVKRVTAVDQSQPDRMVLRQSDDGSFRIVSQSIGLKQKIAKPDAPGVTTSNIAVGYVQECCLSYDNVLRLGQLALDVKNAFKDEREITWTTAPGKIYLSEVSRIPSDPTRSEYEDMHEFDSSYAMDESWTTTSHIDGTFPEVATPLTISTVVRSTAQGLQDMGRAAGSDEKGGVGAVASTTCGRTLINMHDLTSPGASGGGLFDVDAADLERLEQTNGIGGGGGGDDDVESYHGRSPSVVKSLVGRALLTWNVLKTAKSQLQALTSDNEASLRAVEAAQSAADVFRVIDRQLLPSLRDVTRCHVTHVRKFDALRRMARAVLTGCRKEDRSNVTSLDMAHMLASRCGDVTGTIPDSLQRLSECIVDAGCKEEFVALKPMKAAEWLRSGECKGASSLYEKFVETHGHRCIMELELREQSWSQDQTKVVTALQAMVENHPEQKNCPSFDVDLLLDKLKTPLNSFQRVLLRFLVPWLRVATRERDWSISTKMKNVEHLKIAYWKLAKLLKSQCLLPDEDLAFFLTHFELGILAGCPSLAASFVPRAIQRRHVHSRQKNLVFPTVCHQTPQEPLSGPNGACDLIPFNTVLQGTSVCPGKIRAPVRVVSDLSEAFLIQNGEILIVERPDVGWCAYYPLLAGLVTQVGDLTAQGTMMAAQYSLPCVVNVKHALNCFKTGEVVLLDGANGTIQRASGPDPARDDTAMLHA